MASEIGFDQDWVAYKSKVESLIDDLKKLYEDKNSKDFAIVFQDEKIQVHKFVLAFRSNLFRGMFLSVTEDKSNQVSDYFSSGLLALQSLIQFLYLEKIDQELDQSQFTEIVQYYQMNLKYLDEINSFFR
ncbi:hypothetical protein M0811_13971 [Anaeramoeba ignava]|uniref:BTB domain-containing protein n=1 Tax=Anaeramoeba ignava TaxID=1746090 RepID=A0A9Q0LXJ3_ANAIG|nr:hypothetical protein M0811_13971 [Anaeramoeba ignava]